MNPWAGRHDDYCSCFLFQIAGNTQYNLVKFNDIPTDNSDRPVEPVKVFRTQVSRDCTVLPWQNVYYNYRY